MDISSKNIPETHGIDSENDQFLKRSHPMVAQKVQKIRMRRTYPTLSWLALVSLFLDEIWIF